jgi:hypothetical protein
MGPKDIPDDGLDTYFVTMIHSLKIRCQPGQDVAAITKNFGFYRGPDHMEGISKRFGHISVTTLGVATDSIMTTEQYIQGVKHDKRVTGLEVDKEPEDPQ